ncbi:MAG: LysR family transcriptional regulator [Rhodospirillales bacterium CG15_BIG_FIL_POST_REV_8_21_14_020_66_15]|nr:MAG: LysR family transcriptional regulator [Rhodospirillales bacterium CG15_BIG_FIL_POST_REV_8_21_14_020_66_15]
MEFSDLRLFETVARTGAMNRAAVELNTVQSNVTARVRVLEEGLGTALFERHSRGVRLTPAGERLLPFAKAAARLIDDARRAVADDGVPRGELVIGSLETTAAMHLSPVLTGFARSHPSVDLAIRTGTTAELTEDVLENRVEGAFVCGPLDHPDILAETAFHEDLVAVTAPGVEDLRALARNGEVKIVVLRVGCSYRRKLEEVLAARGVTGLRTLEFGTIETILGCVAAGVGVTLLPRGIARELAERGRVRLHALPAREGRVTTLFIRRRDGYRSPAMAAFMDHLYPVRAAAQ